MGRKKIPGLFKRYGLWQIDKTVCGRRICESTGTDDLAQAEQYLAHLIEQVRQTALFGERKRWLFKEAVTKFLEEKNRQEKASIDRDKTSLRNLNPFIGNLHLDELHNKSLYPYIDAMKAKGRKNATINHGLKVVSQILRLAASEWIDENGNTWLAYAPRIRLLDLNDATPARPITWEEQKKLFEALPIHLRRMCIFAVNTGCRDQEICNLRWEWEWEYAYDGKTYSIFIIPAWIRDHKSGELKGLVKNRLDRLVVLNREAMQVVEECRGEHDIFVFTYRNKPLYQMNNSGWKAARDQVGLKGVRVHDLKHTFGARLRAANVSREDRKDLLGHKSRDITTHYSAAQIESLIKAANSVLELDARRPAEFRPKVAPSTKIRESYVHGFYIKTN